MIDKLLYAKVPPHLKRSINVAFSGNGTYEQIVTQLEREVELSGLETDGELPIPKMTITTTTINKQTQAQNAEKQQIICRYCKKNQNMSSKNAENAFAKNKNYRVKNNLPKDQMQKHTHHVHTAEVLITHRTCAGMAQTRLTDLEDTKLKILIIQQTTVINQERLHKMPDIYSHESF